MNARKNLYLFLIVIFLTTLACWPPGNDTEAPPAGGDAVETSVAATLTAQGAGGSPATAPPSPGTQAPPNAPPPSVTQAPATSPPVNPPPPPPAVLRIAYNDGNNVRLWTDGVGVTTLYTGERVTDLLLSDDGQVVAFETQSPQWMFTGLWVARTDGSGVQRLVDAPTMNTFNTNPSALGAAPSQMRFVPGTHTLAFNTRLVFEGPGLVLQDDLRLLNMDTGVLTTLLGVGQAGMFYYSPDGSQIALTTPTSISLINADGSNRRDNVLIYPIVITYSEYNWYSSPNWWPESSQLSVVIPSADPFAPGASMTVWNVPLDGSPAFFLGTYTTDLALFDSDTLISPDMTRVAYLQRVGQPANNTWDFHLVELYGASDTVFSTGDLRFVSWSPNSGWFVYTENQDMKVAQYGNPGSWPLADHPPARDMKWIDDNRFIYVSGSYGSWDLRMGSFSWPSVQIGTSTADQMMLFDFSN